MHFDWTISAGTVIAIFVFIGTMIGIYMKLVSRIDKMEVQLELIFDWWRRMWEPTMPLPTAASLRQHHKSRRTVERDDVQ